MSVVLTSASSPGFCSPGVSMPAGSLGIGSPRFSSPGVSMPAGSLGISGLGVSSPGVSRSAVGIAGPGMAHLGVACLGAACLGTACLGTACLGAASVAGAGLSQGRFLLRRGAVSLLLSLGPHRGDLLAQGLDVRVPVGDSVRDAQQRVIGSSHVVAEQRRRQVQPCHLGRAAEVVLTGCGVRRELRQLAAPAHRHDDDAGQDDQGSEEQDNGHSKNRAMPGDVVRPDLARQRSGRTLLIAAAADLAAASAAVTAGADVVDLGAMPPARVARFRRGHPEVPICTDTGLTDTGLTDTGPGDTGPGDIVRDRRAALAAGASLLCPGRDVASSAGLPPERLLVQASVADLPELVAAGWAVLVDADQAAGACAESGTNAGSRRRHAAGPPATGTAGPVDGSTAAGTGTAAIADILAVAAVSGWLGAAAVRTSHVAAVRRALDMTASIAGVRPPAAAVRGLA
jgi:dihydropteroate synthase